MSVGTFLPGALRLFASGSVSVVGWSPRLDYLSRGLFDSVHLAFGELLLNMKCDVGRSETLGITVQQHFNDVTQVRHQAEKIMNYNCFTQGNYPKSVKEMQ